MAGYSVAKRSVFVIDAKGIVKYSWISENPAVEPDYSAITEILKK